MADGVVATLGRHSLFEPSFGVPDTLTVGRRNDIQVNPLMTPQGFCGGEEPGFVFPVCNYD